VDVDAIDQLHKNFQEEPLNSTRFPGFPECCRHPVIRRTLQTVGVEQIFALLVRLNATLGTSQALPGESPQQTLALEAVGGRRGRPDDELVRRRARDRVDESLQRLAVDVLLLFAHTCHNRLSSRPQGNAARRGNGAPSFSQRGGASPLFPPKCNDFCVSYIIYTYNLNVSFLLTFPQRISAQ